MEWGVDDFSTKQRNGSEGDRRTNTFPLSFFPASTASSARGERMETNKNAKGVTRIILTRRSAFYV